MALPKTKDMTVEEFEAFIARLENRDRYFELIEGAIVEKAMPTREHSLIVGLIITFLNNYFMVYMPGVLAGPEARYRIPNDQRNARLPDVSAILDPEAPVVTRGATPRMPDFIAEVKSPDDNNDDLRERARFYIANGVRLVWLVFPRERIVEVYRPGVPSEMFTAEDTLEGYDVLPGFSVAVAKLLVTQRSG